MKLRCLSALVLAFALTALAEQRVRVTLDTRSGQVPPLRAEGYTELMPDVVLTSVPATPGGPAINAGETSTFCFALSPVQITSRMLPGPSNSEPLFTEALLLIDDPKPEEQFLGKNVFPAKLMSCPYQQSLFPNPALVWENVPVYPSTKKHRLTNLRVNAVLARSLTPVPISLLISNIDVDPPQVVLGPVLDSLAFSVRNMDSSAPLPDGFALPQCAALTQTRIATVRFAELFPGAFRPRQSPDPPGNATPGQPFTTETGFYNPRFTVGALSPGLADHGTRLRATFNKIPAGATIFVDALNSTTTHTARLIDGNSVPLPLPAASDKVQLQVVKGSAVAVWEVLSEDPSVTDNLEFGVYLSYPTPPGPPPAALPSNITVQGGYWPIWPSAEIPSFADTSTPVPLVQFGPCTLMITSVSPLTPGVAGTPYSQQLTALGGDGLTWAPASTLPPGLILDTAGRLSGIPTVPTVPGQFCFDAMVTSGLQVTRKTLCIRISDLHIVTSGTLPDAVVGRTCPLIKLQAAGGTPPYIWSVAPGGLTGIVQPDGTLLCQALSAGLNCFTAQVTDTSDPPVSLLATPSFCLNVLPLATAIITGLPNAVDPNGTQLIQVMLQNPHPRDILCTLTANFQPGDLAVPLNLNDEDQGGVGFPVGQSTKFTILAGSSIQAPPMMLRTGNLAGLITLTTSLSLIDGTPIGSQPAFQQSASVPLMRPAVTDLKIQRHQGGFDICVTGFATNREVTMATFDFEPAPGVVLQGNPARLQVGPVFDAAYREEGSDSAFLYLQSFQLNGNVGGLTSVTVTLANSRTEGAPEIATRKAMFADFPSGSVCTPLN